MKTLRKQSKNSGKKGIAKNVFLFVCFKSKIKVASLVPFFVPNISDHKKLGLFLGFQYILSYRQRSQLGNISSGY